MIASAANTGHPSVPLPPPHADERGSIQPLVDSHFKSAQLICSSAGTVRGNHYHRTDSHQIYVVSGRFTYYWRAAESDDLSNEIIVGPGELILTPAMVGHALRFHQDTIFINFSDNPRDQAAYEADVVRIQLVAQGDLQAP
jgi:dTDP-4-dehydrorhamnose 3,5-epimerase-like enzyme